MSGGDKTLSPGVTKLVILLTRCPLLFTLWLGYCIITQLQKYEQIVPLNASNKRAFQLVWNEKKVGVFSFISDYLKIIHLIQKYPSLCTLHQAIDLEPIDFEHFIEDMDFIEEPDLNMV